MQTIQLSKEAIKSAWFEVFPLSTISVTDGALGGGLYAKGYLQIRGEWTNGISDNDPLHYMFSICNGDYEEVYASIIINPDNQYMYSNSAKMRKKTIKNITIEQLKNRFEQLKAHILANKNQWHKNYSEIINMKVGA